jgi:titin
MHAFGGIALTVALATAATPMSPAGAAVPAAPKKPMVTGIGDGSAHLSWTLPANDPSVTGFVVGVYVSGVLSTSHPVGAPTATTISGLTNGTTYTFTVAATNASGTGPESVPSQAVVVGAPTLPDKPTATAGNASATVHWIASASGNGAPVTGYVVTPFVGSQALSGVQFNSTATKQTLHGLTNAKRYTFKVAGVNARGVGRNSAATLAIVVGTPSVPMNVTATAGKGLVTVRWRTPASTNGAPITGYVVTTSRGPTVVSKKNVAASARALVVKGLHAGQSYGFSVAARNARGVGAGSPKKYQTPK